MTVVFFVLFFDLLVRSNKEQFKKDLMNIARTTLSSKILQGDKDHFAKLCVEAVLKLDVCHSIYDKIKSIEQQIHIFF